MERGAIMTQNKKDNNNDQLNKTKFASQNIQVFLRVRPPLRSEFGKEVAVTCDKSRKTLTINTKANLVQSTLDGAFDETASQAEIFRQIEFNIPAVLQGYNCTVFAYGQTGSGKTHTMFGSDWEHVLAKTKGHVNIQTTFVDDIRNDNNYSGLIPRVIDRMYNEIQLEENKPSNFVVYCSFLQIYNEKIFDLLADNYSANSLNIRENKIDGIYVEGLTEYCCSNFQECIMLMQRGEKSRFIRHTSNNVKSSRSHTIFQMTVESTKADHAGRLQKAKFNLCDLAGSEKLNKDENIEVAHLKELKNINLSLTTLGKVIQNLSQGSKLPIPYRESKLTRLLQDSLGGNTKTCLIATINPLLEYVDESLSTLKFAERAKHIVTEVKANKIEAIDAELIGKLQNEIKYLKEILNIRRKGTSAINQVHNKLLMLQEENDRLRQAQMNVDEVEKLMQENRIMKMELQNLRFDVTSEKFTDHPIINFDAGGDASNFQTPPQMHSPKEKAYSEKVEDILDKFQGSPDRKDKLGTTQSNKFANTQSNKSEKFFEPPNYIDFKNNSDVGSPHNTSGFMMTGKVVTSQARSQERGSAPINLPTRVKGAKNAQSTELPKNKAVKSEQETQKVNQRKMDQQRALRRLQDLEDWQRKVKAKGKGEESPVRYRAADPSVSDFTPADIRQTPTRHTPLQLRESQSETTYKSTNFREEVYSSPQKKDEYQSPYKREELVSPQKSEVNSVHNSETLSQASASGDKAANRYQFVDFDQMYNPYKVRQEIEKKYNNAQSKPNLPRNPRQNSDNAARLKNIEKNFF